MNKQLLTSILFLVVGAVLVSVGFMIGIAGQKDVVVSPLGGHIHNIQESFDAGIAVNLVEVIDDTGTWVETLGGGKLVLTATTSNPDGLELTAANVCDNSLITWNYASSSTTTLPTATSTVADCMKDDGDQRFILFENLSSTGTTTIKAGAGIDLLEPSGGDVIIVGGEWAKMLWTTVSSTEVAVEITSIQDAD